MSKKKSGSSSRGQNILLKKRYQGERDIVMRNEKRPFLAMVRDEGKER